MGKITLEDVLPEKHCAKCGKLFIPAPEHIFKHGSKYYCKWTCYLHRNDPEVKKKDDKGTT